MRGWNWRWLVIGALCSACAGTEPGAASDGAAPPDAGAAPEAGPSGDAAGQEAAPTSECAPVTTSDADAGSWSPPAPQAPPEPLPEQPHRGEVLCGDELACPAGEHCCAEMRPTYSSRFSGADGSYAIYHGCDTSPDCARFPTANTVLYCDGPEDCLSGQSCCGNASAGTGISGAYPSGAFRYFYQGVAPTWCAASCACNAAELCRTDADCPGGSACFDPAAYARLTDATLVATVWYLPYRICSAAACVSAEPSAPSEDAGVDGLADDSARVRVTVGQRHACAIARDARITCWGDDSVGQSSPPAGTFVAIEAGGDRTCAIRSSGQLACWGENAGCVNPTPEGQFTDVSVSESHACAVRADGEVSCWGDHRVGQSISVAGTYVDVSAALGTSCAIRRDDGAAICWGLEGTTETPGPWVRVEAAPGFVCLIDENQMMSCGGIGAPTSPSGPVTDVALYAAAGYVVDWRLDENGMVGGSFANASSVGTGPYRQIAGDNGGACAVRLDGGIECWALQDTPLTQVPAELQ